MYTRFHVERFRGIDHLDVPLTRVTVVTGRNGVGKSALLEALFLHACGPHGPLSAIHVLRPMRNLPAVAFTSSGEPVDPWRTFFPANDQGATIALVADVDGARRGVHLRQQASGSASVLVDANGAPRSALGVEVRLTGDDDEELAQHRLLPSVNTRTGGVDIHVVPDDVGPAIETVRIVKDVGAVDVVEAYTSLRLAGGAETLVDALRAVDPRIRGVELLASEGPTALHAVFDAGPPLPFSSLGMGMNRALTYLLAASTAPGGLVLIDEVEDGLHHSVLERLWRHLVEATRSTGTQLVVTTHSDEAVRGALLALGDSHLDELSLVRLRDARRDTPAGWAEAAGVVERAVAAVVLSGPAVAQVLAVPAEVR